MAAYAVPLMLVLWVGLVDAQIMHYNNILLSMIVICDACQCVGYISDIWNKIVCVVSSFRLGHHNNIDICDTHRYASLM